MNKTLVGLFSIVCFSVITAVCYLWGYWGTFDIEIINHIELGELIVLATVPLLGIAIMMLVCISLASILRLDLRNDPNRSGASAAIGSFIRPEAIYILSLVGIILIVVIGGTAQWLLLAIPFAFFTTTFIVFNNIFDSTEFNKRDLFFVVLIATLLPSMGFGYGKTKGLLIEQGISYKNIVAAQNLGIDNNSDFRFLGTVGEQAFILDGKKNDKIIIALEQLQPLVLSDVPQRNTPNPAIPILDPDS